MRPEFMKLQEDREYFQKIESLSDRELLELQTRYLSQTEKTSRRTMLNVQFFFYFFIFLALVWVFLFLTATGPN